MEFSRQEYWSEMPFPSPGGLPDPGMEQRLLHCRQILYCWAHGLQIPDILNADNLKTVREWEFDLRSILTWRLLRTVQSMGLQRVGHNWATNTFTFKMRKVCANDAVPMRCKEKAVKAIDRNSGGTGTERRVSWHRWGNDCSGLIVFT